MSFTVTFQTAEARNIFAKRVGKAQENSTSIVINDNLFTYSMRYAGAEVIHDGSNIKLLVETADLESCPEHTVVSAQDGYTIIETADPIGVYNACSGNVDCVDAPVKLLSVLSGSTIASPNDWARRRLSNRFRPFRDYKTFDVSITNKPIVFVVDSGISPHADLSGVQIVNFGKLSFCSNYSDNLGHGTAVASCIAGEKVGLTANVDLYNYKVFDGDTKPTILELANVLDDIKQFKLSNQAKNVVVNISWTVTYSNFLRNKFAELLNAGCVVVCSAGNTADDVSNFTPAGMPEVITVGAIDDDDIVAGFTATSESDSSITSPSGQSLDIFAPGVDVDVASINGGFIRVSGTSMAAAYASGAASIIQSVSPDPVTHAEVLNLLVATSLKGSILFDRQAFSSNQNRIVQIINGDGMSDDSLYAGTLSPDAPKITIDSKSFGFNYTADIVGEDTTYSIIWENAEQQERYRPFFAFNKGTGSFMIDNPIINLPDGELFERVAFDVVKTTNYSSETCKVFFYYTSETTAPQVLIEDLDSSPYVDISSNFQLNNLFNPTVKP